MAFRHLRRFTWWKAIAAAVALAGLLAGGVALVWAARHARAISRLRTGAGDTVFYAADGAPWFRMDEQHDEVPLAAISPFLRQAVIAVEDHRFYRHRGIDLAGVGRAAIRNLRGRRVQEGASTLTQQLARTLFLSNRKTWGRKVREAVLALLIEQQLSKERILELYLNRIYLSGVYGVQPMARRLYGKHARDLTLAEAAVIAGVIQAPSALSPWSNPQGAIRRSHTVLVRMREVGAISGAQERSALDERLRFLPFVAPDAGRSGYVREYLRQQFRKEFGGDHPPGWQVRTTIVPAVQRAAEEAVDNGLRRLGIAGLQAALVAFDPETGDLLALVGGRDYHESAFDRATRSRRQPGSAFKPFVYAAALERGLTPVSAVPALDRTPPDGPAEWTPRNAHEADSAELTLRNALIRSDNRAAVAIGRHVGSRAVIDLAARLGLPGQPDVPSLPLGAGVATPFDLTLAYSVFPNGGLRVLPRSIVSVTDAGGDGVLDRAVSTERVISRETAFQMVSILEDVVARGTGAGARRWGVRFAVGGKTGTTNDFKDSWFVGFSTEVVAGVWVGFDQPASMGQDAFGARLALPIWSEFMRRGARGLRPPRSFEPPATLRAEALCQVSSRQPMQDCPTYTEYFKAGDDVPSEFCAIHGGSVRQRVERAVGGVLRALGRAVKDIFGKSSDSSRPSPPPSPR